MVTQSKAPLPRLPEVALVRVSVSATCVRVIAVMTDSDSIRHSPDWESPPVGLPFRQSFPALGEGVRTLYSVVPTLY
jgi:hypothetical protein